MKVTFIQSGVKPQDFPEEDRPEVALAGRSNAGKSSFLNAIANQKVARVSAQPGKTRLLNFFNAGDNYRIVDMPGYGYAARSGAERTSWRKMVEGYLKKRGSLVGLVLIMDIRRKWTAEEQLLIDFCLSRDLPWFVILNKVDKVRHGEKVKFKRAIAEVAGAENVFCTSSSKNKGIKEVEEAIFEQWVKPEVAQGEE
ncbi:MAG: ribosome biogenesis GTP-binding protein YsxC [Bdellovibrionaceae bacterium]|nr:ribosome biogenesis GTP-binding protein YsxC [Bdellovibrionales bacterium]MCB9086134.1 ribosome biogenesis GTP-binding protein YsxC [Pseudobdellovibrionaceae bacterium]